MAETSNLPQTLSSAQELDPYEARYMSGDGVVRCRSKVGGTWQVPAFTGLTSAFLLVWCAAHGGLGLGLAASALLVLGGLFFSVIRVTITSTIVDVHFGLMGPKIPLDAIESVKPVVHDHQSFLRWGITPLGKGQWLYTIPGDEGRAVKIVWRGARGQRTVHYIGCQDHEALAAEIQQARDQLRFREALGEG